MPQNLKHKAVIITAFTATLAGFGLALVLYTLLPSLKPAEKVLAAPNKTEYQAMEDFQNIFRKVAAEALPWVVEIDVVKVSTDKRPGWGNGIPWDFFFGNPGGSEQEGQEPREFRSSGLGSGFIVKRDGNVYYVITNNHVAGTADEISVKLENGDEVEAELVGKDPRRDLALLKFKSKKNLPVARLGNSDELYVGDWVLAIGSPFGFKSSVSAGIISALGRQNGPDGNINDFIQTDAAINQGNSGGPLVNMKGEVIGINTWITTSSGGSIGLGFSIPINNIKKIINDFIENGEVRYGWLGVSIGDLSQDGVEALDIDEKYGAFVFQVFTNSPADKGGIIPGDYILSVNGQKAQDRNHLTRLIGDMHPGEIADFSLLRGGRKKKVSVKIKERADEKEVKKMNSRAWPGVTAFPITQELIKRMELDEDQTGVVVAEVYPKTSMQVAGLKSGDIITGINNHDIKGLADFYKALGSIGKDKFYVTFLREGYEMESPKVRKK